MTFISDGVSWLAEQFATHESVEVTYRRGGEIVVLDATLGGQLLRTTDGRGNTRMERADRDFIFNVADLILYGNPATPERGDRIEATIGNVTERYEVLPIGNEPAWRYSDAHKTRIRVHTKRVKEL